MDGDIELKNRIKDYLKQSILHATGVLRDGLKKRAYNVGIEYNDGHLPLEIIESIGKLEEGEEKEKRFELLCEKIVFNLVEFKKHTEYKAPNGVDWRPKINIENFLFFISR